MQQIRTQHQYMQNSLLVPPSMPVIDGGKSSSREVGNSQTHGVDLHDHAVLIFLFGIFGTLLKFALFIVYVSLRDA
jgi:hypothetical protein